MYHIRPNLLLGFHGCDESVQQKLLNQPKKVKISKKPYDWLGHGFYVWENNYARALQWAKEKEKRGEISKAAVIGVVFTLENCLDLLDSLYIEQLSLIHNLMKMEFSSLNKQLPVNKNVLSDIHNDLLIRNLDCAVIEFMHNKIDEGVSGKIKPFDTVRGVFTEGGPAFPGAGIQKKSHIQVCIRNTDCIKGFFLPRL